MATSGIDVHDVLAVNDAAVVLSESLVLADVIPRYIDRIMPLIGGDFAAFATLSREDPSSLIWMPTRHQPPLLKHYSLLERDDFVAKSLRSHPNEVRRDQEMISAKEMRRNLMFTTAMDMGAPLRHVIAFTVVGRDGSFGGFSVYRTSKRPFGDRESFLLSQTMNPLRNALVNCREVELERACFDAMAMDQPCILLAPDGREYRRLYGAQTLMNEWFDDVERSRESIPDVLMTEWRCRKSQDPSERRDDAPYFRQRDGKRLDVYFLPVPRTGGMWKLVLKQYSLDPELPREMVRVHRLSPEDQKVAKLVLQGKTEKDIAIELQISLSRAHDLVKRLFAKCGVVGGRQVFRKLVDDFHRKDWR